MKKLTLLMVLTFAVVCGLQAQKLKLGIKGGLNLPSQGQFELVPEEFIDGASGYHIGAFASIKLGPLAVQPEVLYSFVNYKLDLPIIGESDTKISYVTVPIMAKFYPIPKVNLQAGPQFGILSGAKLGDEDIDETIKGADIGFAVGAGVDLPAGLDLHARYIFGISDVNDVDSQDAGTLRNSSIQISVGFAFFKKG